MISLSCAGKFHAFNLAEYLVGQNLLSRFYTRYAYQRNTLMRAFVSRTDKEQIPAERIQTMIPLAIAARLRLSSEYTNSHLYDRWVAAQLKRRSASYQTFIGWSSMSLVSIRQAKQDGKLTIVERGAAHIEQQDAILQDEYGRFGLSFQINPRVVAKECQEYDEADYIVIPSQFVKRTFLERGVPEHKLLVNPYGVSTHFRPASSSPAGGRAPRFTILYLGALTIQKGLLYLFQALHELNLPTSHYDVWFVGQVADELKPTIARYQRPNWTFWGHVNHYDLPTLIGKAHVGVQPSVQDGFSMVVPQMLAVGLPVILTPNNGAADSIVDGQNGFVVPIRSPRPIAHHLQRLYESPALLQHMQTQAATRQQDGSWDAYGKRYVFDLQRITTLAGLPTP